MQKIFLFGLVLIIPFYYGVTGVRFWPALYLFITFAIKYLHHRKLNYLLLAAASILIHYSFIVPFLTLIVASIIPNNRFLYRIIVIFSIIIFVLSSVSSSLGIIKEVFSNFDETTLETSVEAYTDEDALSDRKELGLKNNWYVSLKSDTILYFFLILGVLDVMGLFKFKENEFLINTYPLLVLFLVLFLLTKDLGSISRFRNIYYLLIISRYLILSGLQPFDRKIKFISYTFTPILIFYTVVTFRAGFYTVEPFLLINNAVSTFYIHSSISLSEFIIGH